MFHCLVFRQKGTSRTANHHGKSCLEKDFVLHFTKRHAIRSRITDSPGLAARSHSKRDAVCCGMSSVSVAGSKLKSIKLDQIGGQGKIKTDEKRRTADGTSRAAALKSMGRRACSSSRRWREKEIAKSGATDKLKGELERLTRIRKGLERMIESTRPSKGIDDSNESLRVSESGAVGIEDVERPSYDRRQTRNMNVSRRQRLTMCLVRKVRDVLSKHEGPEVVLSLRDIIQCLDDDRTRKITFQEEDDQWAEALVERVSQADAIQTVPRSTSQVLVELVRQET